MNSFTGQPSDAKQSEAYINAKRYLNQRPGPIRRGEWVAKSSRPDPGPEMIQRTLGVRPPMYDVRNLRIYGGRVMNVGAISRGPSLQRRGKGL